MKTACIKEPKYEYSSNFWNIHKRVPSKHVRLTRRITWGSLGSLKVTTKLSTISLILIPRATLFTLRKKNSSDVTRQNEVKITHLRPLNWLWDVAMFTTRTVEIMFYWRISPDCCKKHPKNLLQKLRRKSWGSLTILIIYVIRRTSELISVQQNSGKELRSSKRPQSWWFIFNVNCDRLVWKSGIFELYLHGSVGR